MQRIILASLLLGSACGGSKPSPASVPAAEAAKPVAEAPPPAAAAPKRATANLVGTSKWKAVTGTVQFTETDDGVEVVANLEGLKKGDHGIHIHEIGDCSGPDAKSAGGHFNPGNHKHGAVDAAERHGGDLGNIAAGKDGKATATVTAKGISLQDGDASIVGKSLIVHDKADDLKTQPSGNSGDRIACGIITLDAAAP